MLRLAPKPLSLDERERQQLQQIINRHSTAQQIALRAQIILLAAQEYNHRDIARALNISREMAALWRERWRRQSEKGVPVVERLQDAERSGSPALFSLEQILQLFSIAKRCCEAQIACEKPETYGRPISHWTARELAEEMVKQGIVERLSPRHVGRLLEEASLKPHQSSYWLNPPPTLSLTTKSQTSAKPTRAP